MPNTREKLIEVKNALSMCYKQGITSECEGCKYKGRESICMDALMEDALAVINRLEEKQATSDWIPVTERLPEKDGDYIVYTKYGVYEVLGFAKDGRKIHKYDFARDWKNVWYSYESEYGYFTTDSATHWMPLPEPPKGE